MSEPKSVCIEVIDVFEDMKSENNRLLDELLFAQKCNHFLHKFRQNLKQFNENCVCIQTIESKLQFNALENEFKGFSKIFIKKYSKNNKKVIQNSVSNKWTQFRRRVDVFGNKTIVSTESDVLDNKTVISKSKYLHISRDEESEERERKLKKIEIQGQIIREIHRKKFKNKQNIKNNKSIESIDENNCFHSKAVDDCNGSESEGLMTETQESNHRSDEGMDKNSESNIETKSEVHYYKCWECNKTYDSQMSYKKHIRFRHNRCFDTKTNTFRCNWKECSYVSPNYSRLVSHLCIHQQIRAFKCVWPGCDASFVMKSTLLKHNRSHLGVKNYSCDICGKRFMNTRNLKVHNWIHTEEKNFMCEWPGCEARFRTKSTLNRHRREVHKSGEVYSCDWPGCSKEYHSKKTLENHTRNHTGVKLCLKCRYDGCDQSFTTFNRRSHHYRKVHKTIETKT